VLAFSGYVGVSFLFFGLRVVFQPRLSYVGTGVDPQIFIWSFAWWPHAILQGVNPFVTHVVWAPSGLNLAWTTSVPGLALLFAPLTLLLGPVAAFNVAAVLMPAAAASTCFLLCRHLTRSIWPSLVGGYLFGFSSYMLGQQEGHLQMTSVFLLPLVALTIIRRLQETISRRRFQIQLGTLLALQLSFSSELFFTLTLAIATAAVAAFVADPALRSGLKSLVVPLLTSFLLAGLITSPFLYYAATGFDAHSINAPRRFAADLLNLIVPTKLVLASANRTETIASHFLGNDSERGSYLGLPTLTMIALFAWRRGRTASGKLLILCLTAATVAELGASLRVDGRRLLPLPLSLIDHLSLFDNVLPARIAVYVSLLAALTVALWAAQTASRRLSIALPALAVIALLPRPGSHAWITEPDNPRFISERVYQSCLKPGENTLIYPFGAKGNSMLWQAESSFWFRLAGGYLSPTIPAPFRRFRAAHANLHPSITAADIRQLARAKNVTAIIVDERHRTPWHALLPGTPTKIADILLYQVAGPTSANAVVSHGKAPTRLGVTRSCPATSRS